MRRAEAACLKHRLIPGGDQACHRPVPCCPSRLCSLQGHHAGLARARVEGAFRTFWQYFFSLSFSSLFFSSCREAADKRKHRKLTSDPGARVRSAPKRTGTGIMPPPFPHTNAHVGGGGTRDAHTHTHTGIRSVHSRMGSPGAAGGKVSDCSCALSELYSARVAAAGESRTRDWVQRAAGTVPATQPVACSAHPLCKAAQAWAAASSSPEKVSPRHTHSICRRHVLPGRLKSHAAQSSSAGRRWAAGLQKPSVEPKVWAIQPPTRHSWKAAGGG